MYEKYLTALELMDACIATKFNIKQSCVDTWDDCFDFILANFAKPQTARQDGVPVDWSTKHSEIDLVRPLIDGTYKTQGQEIEDVLRGIPPALAEEIFPVGIARYLLRDMNLPFDHRQSRTFKQFVSWYGTMILCC